MFTNNETFFFQCYYFILNEICPFLDRSYSRHKGLINHILPSWTTCTMIQVIMAKQKLVTFKSGTSKSNPPTIIIWSKNFDDFFCANDFGHAIMLIVLLHIKTLSVGLGATPFNTPNSMTTNISAHYHTIVHEIKNSIAHILSGLTTMYIWCNVHGSGNFISPQMKAINIVMKIFLPSYGKICRFYLGFKNLLTFQVQHLWCIRGTWGIFCNSYWHL